MAHMMQPRVVVLKEGTDTSQGRGQIISNINACEAIVEILKTTLGPCGMDKLIHEANGKVTISNDGATIIKLLDIVHPAAKTLVDIARSQDDEVGDGTTTVTLLAGEFLRNVKQYIEDGVHSQIVIKGYRKATKFALAELSKLAINVDKTDDVKTREMLMKCAGTALNSKLISGQKPFFSKMAVDAILHLNHDKDLHKIGMKRVPGGSVCDSMLIEGVAFKKTFSYAGFEQQPKSFDNVQVCLLNVELELKAERSNAEVRIKKVEDYAKIVDGEWKIIYDKLDKIVASGAKIVLSSMPVGDLATQYFADRDIFCAGRVERGDMERVAVATGAVTQTSLNDLSDAVLGTVGHFEERQVGADRFNFFEKLPLSKTVTIILRGGAEQFIEEAERSLHDSIMIVKRAVQHSQVVAGGGAIEMELSRRLQDFALTIPGKEQMIINAFAQSLEMIPRQISENAGFDSTDIVIKLREKHAKGATWFGVDIENEGVCDTLEAFVWEPALVKRNALAAASEAACMILSVDETVKNPKSENTDNRQAKNASGAWN